MFELLSDSQRLSLAPDQMVIAALNRSLRRDTLQSTAAAELTGSSTSLVLSVASGLTPSRTRRSHTSATQLHNNRRFLARLTK
jgi:hypothetical protein